MTTASEDRNFIEAVIDIRLLESSMEWIAKNMNPEEVFDEKKLDQWAQDNGYSKEA